MAVSSSSGSSGSVGVGWGGVARRVITAHKGIGPTIQAMSGNQLELHKSISLQSSGGVVAVIVPEIVSKKNYFHLSEKLSVYSNYVYCTVNHVSSPRRLRFKC